MSGCKRQLVGMAALIGVGVLVLTAWLLWPRTTITTAITLENAATIKEGMTRAEVEAILGGPPRDETEAAGMIVNLPKGFGGFGPGTLFWISHTTVCGVEFDDTGRVVGVHAFAAHPHESTFHRLCPWLGL
jgi:hypothetical protein